MADLLVTENLALKVQAKNRTIEEATMARLAAQMVEIICRKEKSDVAARDIVAMPAFINLFSKTIADKKTEMGDVPGIDINEAIIEECLEFHQHGLCRSCSSAEVVVEISWLNVYRAIGDDCVTAQSCVTIDDMSDGEVESKIMSEACHWHESERAKINRGCGNSSLYPERLINAVLFNPNTRRVNVCESCEEALVERITPIAERTSKAINSLTCLYSDGQVNAKTPPKKPVIQFPWAKLDEAV